VLDIKCVFFFVIVENIPYSNKYLGNYLQDMHMNVSLHVHMSTICISF